MSDKQREGGAMLSKAAIRLAHRLLDDAIIGPPRKPLNELIDAGFLVAVDFFRGEGQHAYIFDHDRQGFHEQLEAVEAEDES